MGRLWRPEREAPCYQLACGEACFIVCIQPIMNPSASPRVSTTSLRIFGATPYMTELLQKAFEQASKLPAPEQDALASALLEEIKAEQKWDATLAESQDDLAGLADAALAEQRAGDTKQLDPDKL